MFERETGVNTKVLTHEPVRLKLPGDAEGSGDEMVNVDYSLGTPLL